MSSKYQIQQCRYGRGVFVREAFAPNEFILEMQGPTISLRQALSLPDQSHPLQIGRGEYIHLQEPSVLVNHSCNPNAGLRQDRFLVALQTIMPGQEICYDYSTTMDEDLWTMTCSCQEKNCRSRITDFKRLPNELQRKYLELNIVQGFIAENYLGLPHQL